MTLTDYVKSCRETAYLEKPSDLHTEIAWAQWSELQKFFPLPDRFDALVLGCGCGHEMEMMRLWDNPNSQCRPNVLIGLTVSDDEARICRDKGLCVMVGDMHEAAFGSITFDLVYARHVLEHSPIPGFMAKRCFDWIRPGGVLYAEVPAPGTVAVHEFNPSHYSVLGWEMWAQHFKRAGFSDVMFSRIGVPLEKGSDEYLSFICKKTG